MTRRPLSFAAASCFIVAMMFAPASAETVFFDDFSDGSVTNDVPLDNVGNPVIWTPRSDRLGDYDASSGDYVLTPTIESTMTLASQVLNKTLTDTSIRTQLRISIIDGFAGVSVRNQVQVGPAENYFAGVFNDDNSTGTQLFILRADPVGGTTTLGVTDVQPFDALKEDVLLQLDVFGNELKLWGWRPGDPMPDPPQLIATDDTYAGGTVGILNGLNNNSAGTFRFVQVADMHIPEPSTLTLLWLGMSSVFGFRFVHRRRRSQATG